MRQALFAQERQRAERSPIIVTKRIISELRRRRWSRVGRWPAARGHHDRQQMLETVNSAPTEMPMYGPQRLGAGARPKMAAGK